MDHNQTSLENTIIDSTDDTLCTKRPYSNNHDEPDVAMINNDNNDNDGSRINHTNHNPPDGLMGGNALDASSSSQLSYTTSSSKDTHTLSQETLRLSQDGIYDAQTVDPNPAATTSSTSAVHHATDAGDEVLEETLDSYSSSPLPPPSTHTSNDASSPPPMLEPREQSNFIHPLRYLELVDGETWYLIESRWWHRWQTYCTRMSSDIKTTKELGVSTSPGPITNEELFADKERTKLKKELIVDAGVMIVPQRAWDALTTWYGTVHPPLSRQVIKVEGQCRLELYPPQLHLHLFTTASTNNITPPTTPPLLSLSCTTRVRAFKHAISQALNLPAATDFRVHRLLGRDSAADLTSTSFSLSVLSTTERLTLTPQSDGDTIAEAANLVTDDHLVIEVRNMLGGEWPSESVTSSTALTLASPASAPPPAYSAANSSTYSSYSNGYGSSSSSYGDNWMRGDTTTVREPTVPKGVTGLVNLGNTCFMNAALQCLSNTKELSEYFLASRHEEELNCNNPLGMRGEVAKAYGKLIEKLWSGSSSSHAPRDFKQTIGRFAPSFIGYQQHDSQELLGFLLDGLHEDLNRITSKPYIEWPDFDGKPDREVARISWAYHKARNDSIIVDLFQGQFKSELVCPDCEKISVTFDPFMYLSLPLPIQKKMEVKLIYVPYDPARRPVRMTITVNKDASIRQLKDQIVKWMDAGDASRLLMTEVWTHRVYKIFNNADQVSSISTNDHIYMYQLPCPVPPAPKPKATDEPENPEDWIIFPVCWMLTSTPSSMSSYTYMSLFGYPMIIAMTKGEARNPDNVYRVIVQQVERYTNMKLFEEVRQQMPLQLTKEVSEAEEITDEEETTEREEVTKPEVAKDGDVGEESTGMEEGTAMEVVAKDGDVGEESTGMEEGTAMEEEEEAIPAQGELAVEDNGMVVDAQPQDSEMTEMDTNTPTTCDLDGENVPLLPGSTKQNLLATASVTTASVTSAGGRRLEPLKLFTMKVASDTRNGYRSGPPELFALSTMSYSDLSDLRERAAKEAEARAKVMARMKEREEREAGEDGADANGKRKKLQRSSREELGEQRSASPVGSIGSASSGNAAQTYTEDEEVEDAASGSSAMLGGKLLSNMSNMSNAVYSRFKAFTQPPLTPAHVIRQGEVVFIEWPATKAAQILGETATQSHPARKDNMWEEYVEFVDPETEREREETIRGGKKNVTLLDCLQGFLTEEELNEENPWYCPRCRKHQQASKKLDLWRLPEVLVVHLKRFSHTRTFRDKIDAMVEFPIERLDLTDMLLSRAPVEEEMVEKEVEEAKEVSEAEEVEEGDDEKVEDVEKEEGRKAVEEEVDPNERFVYDLFAVDNHFGGLGGGHYTAYAKNFQTGTWHNFDDSHVTSVDVSSVKTSAAYLLFYRRRRATTPPPQGPRAPNLRDTHSVTSTSDDEDPSSPSATTPNATNVLSESDESSLQNLGSLGVGGYSLAQGNLETGTSGRGSPVEANYGSESNTSSGRSSKASSVRGREGEREDAADMMGFTGPNRERATEMECQHEEMD